MAIDERTSDGPGSRWSKLTAGLLSLLAVGLLLALMGFTFASSSIVFVAALPLLVLFSPVVVPAAVTVAAVTLAFGICGAVGLGGLWALRWSWGRLKGRDRPGWSGSVEPLEQPRTNVGDVHHHGWSGPVRRGVTDSGHVVREQEREVDGYRQREVQVKGV